MNRLALSALATTLLIPVGALAQPADMPPPSPGIAEAHAQHYRDYRRLERGAIVPNRWWAPNYVIVDWSGYGLSQPQPGYRWIRYYDDVLLIDDSGRVWDSRYDMDWSRWGSAWSYDADGVPVLIGGGEVHAYAEHHAGAGHQNVKTKRFYSHHPGYGGHRYSYPGYGYGHGGWSYAGYGGAWVTETTVTYQDCCCEAEEAVVYEQPAPVYTPPPPPPPPPPMPGERG